LKSKNRKKSGRFVITRKLWFSFVIFAVIIFSTLWLTQTVFLQKLYNYLQKRSVKNAAQKICKSSNVEQTLMEEVVKAHLLAIVYDENLEIIYVTDEHSSPYDKEKKLFGAEKGSDNSFVDKLLFYQFKIHFSEHYKDFAAQFQTSGESSAEVVTKVNEFIYASYLNDESQILVLAENLGAVGGTVYILRFQLIIVSILSLLLAFIFAVIMSGRISDEKIQKARIELLANVTHDLRTPLTLIRGYAESLKDFTWSDEEKRNHDADIIIRETDRLGNLVNDILDYSAVRESKNPPKIEFNLSRMAHDIINQFGTGRMNIQIEDECIITGDRKQLERVLYNFLDNALRHSPAGEKISVEIKKLTHGVYLGVQNYGTPIPPENIELIWDRYFTARQQRLTGQKSGLGLAITKGILENHGAKYGVKSNEKDGTTFWVIF